MHYFTYTQKLKGLSGLSLIENNVMLVFIMKNIYNSFLFTYYYSMRLMHESIHEWIIDMYTNIVCISVAQFHFKENAVFVK